MSSDLKLKRGRASSHVCRHGSNAAWANGAKGSRARYIAASIRRTAEAWPTNAKRSIAREWAGRARPAPEAIKTDPSKQDGDRVGEEWYDRRCLDALVPGLQEFGKGWCGLQHEGNAGRIVERADPRATHIELAVISKCISKARMSASRSMVNSP
jgi:hypothetical protein